MTLTYRRSYRGKLKAVIFDWAGTTVDFGSMAPTAVFIEVFRQQGVPITVEEARGPMGTYKRTHIEMISRMDSVAQRWRQAHGRPCTDEDIEKMFTAFVPLQLACMAELADVIPGALETVEALRGRGIKIGSTTGYTREMMDILVRESARRGYEPDCVVCATDVPEGRPGPAMCLVNAVRLRAWPMEACVKVDDTVPGIEEGLNAAMWTVGVVMTGNEMGLTQVGLAALDPKEREARRQRGYDRMHQAGAHYVIDGIGDLVAAVDEIEGRLARGDRP